MAGTARPGILDDVRSQAVELRRSARDLSASLRAAAAPRALAEEMELLGYDAARRDAATMILRQAQDEGSLTRHLPAGVSSADSDSPELSDLVDAVEKSNAVFVALAAHGALLPGDFERVHDLFAAARDACAAILSRIPTSQEAADHAR